MQPLADFKISAAHYLFYVHDLIEEVPPSSFTDELDGARVSDVGGYYEGYLTNGKTICFGGCAHRNIYGIKLIHSEAVPRFANAQRVVALPLQISSGVLCVSNHIDIEPTHQVQMPPGDYVVYCLGFDLGKDPTFNLPKTDVLASADVTRSERYEITFVPSEKSPQTFGVLHGVKTIVEIDR